MANEKDPKFVIAPPPQISLPILGGGRFPVRRIFCIGKNYVLHVEEMGGDAKSDPPVYFTKPRDAIVENGGAIPYPPASDDFHFEGELVLALGKGGAHISNADDANAMIFGTACGCDLTRRDLQSKAKAAGGPWDSAKAFDHSAPVGPIVSVSNQPLENTANAELITRVNNEICQQAPIATMIWSMSEIVMALSDFVALAPGDLIFTGTPAGVGPLNKGDAVQIEIGSLPALKFTIAR